MQKTFIPFFILICVASALFYSCTKLKIKKREGTYYGTLFYSYASHSWISPPFSYDTSYATEITVSRSSKDSIVFTFKNGSPISFLWNSSNLYYLSNSGYSSTVYFKFLENDTLYFFSGHGDESSFSDKKLKAVRQ